MDICCPCGNSLGTLKSGREPNNLSQNICNHLTLTITFKSIFSYSSQKTLSMAKRNEERVSSTNNKRYRGNPTQIRWQQIIQFAHFYSTAQTEVEFIFPPLSLFMLFKHYIHQDCERQQIEGEQNYSPNLLGICSHQRRRSANFISCHFFFCVCVLFSEFISKTIHQFMNCLIKLVINQEKHFICFNRKNWDK